MAEDSRHPLKVFLCHASGDKPQVRALYMRLIAEGVDAWLDQERLLPGQNWRIEIPRAVRESDVVVICLSNNSTTKEGYIQKEIKFALDVADEKPEGSIFLIPARLEECVVPEKLSVWQWVDLYENKGFVKLLRSLKLRADKVGAVIERASNVEDDAEAEHRLNQLYTEGLAAFYTEDWDKACQRFQAILSERPNHKNAAEKLEEAERQRDLARSYSQAADALQSADWGPAIKLLEDIVGKSNTYKDASRLLKNARKQKQLGELYEEAKTLHTAQKWQAVIKVFDQISMIDPNHPDVDGLLPSAQKELAELNRLAKLNTLYTNAINEMDSGRWYEARQLLEQIHKSQTGYLETEHLLQKVENEMVKIEEIKKRNDQINILYEQANGLVRSRDWRRALEKMEEIQKLDDQFVDKDGIVGKINKELAREEQKVQRQNELAAKYADAVTLLKEGKYQDALDKWQEVKSIDPKYPDRQRIQKTARKKLDELSKSVRPAGDPVLQKLIASTSIRLGTIIAIVIVGLLFVGYRLWFPRTLFFDSFDGPSLGKEYITFPLPSNGMPDYTFETYDDASVIRLNNWLSDGQRVGWLIAKKFTVNSSSVRVEIRFNTLIQYKTTSIDNFFGVWLFSSDQSEYYLLDAWAGNFGTDRSFMNHRFNFRDNTWYRLVIEETNEQQFTASIYDDTMEKELVKVNLLNNPDAFQSGLQVGITQSMGEPKGTYPVDVAIDWIRVTVNP